MATNEAWYDFKIIRGNGGGNTTVTLNAMTLPSNAYGMVTYTGHICQDCTSDNTFTFEYGGSAEVAKLTFMATSFNVPHCPDDLVKITGIGTITAGTNVFGSNPVYALILNGVTPKSIGVVITGNGNTFTATTTVLGVGELVITNCP
jgi:hypothetical protein